MAERNIGLRLQNHKILTVLKNQTNILERFLTFEIKYIIQTE